MSDLQYCMHEGQASWWEYDARGIELCKVCDKCRRAKLSTYRRDVLADPNYDCDEAIEPEPCVGGMQGIEHDARPDWDSGYNYEGPQREFEE